MDSFVRPFMEHMVALYARRQRIRDPGGAWYQVTGQWQYLEGHTIKKHRYFRSGLENWDGLAQGKNHLGGSRFLGHVRSKLFEASKLIKP